MARAGTVLVLCICLAASASADIILGEACKHLLSSVSPASRNNNDLLAACARHPKKLVRDTCFNFTAADGFLISGLARFDNLDLPTLICPLLSALPSGAQRYLGSCSWMEMAGCAVAISGAVAGCGCEPSMSLS